MYISIYIYICICILLYIYIYFGSWKCEDSFPIHVSQRTHTVTSDPSCQSNVLIPHQVADLLARHLGDHASEAVVMSDSGLTFRDDSDNESDDSGLGTLLGSAH